MKTYLLLLKSYTDQPDYEDELKARSKEQAIAFWYNRLAKNGWDKDTLEKSIIEL